MRRDKPIIWASVVATAVLAGLLTWHVSSWPTHRPDFATSPRPCCGETRSLRDFRSGFVLLRCSPAHGPARWRCGRGNAVEAFVIAAAFGLIGSAHAMGYEFAMFAPACPALIARRRWSAPAIFLFLLFPAFIWAGLPAFPFRLLAVLLLIAAAVADGILAATGTGAGRDAELASPTGAHDNKADMAREPSG